MKIDIDDDICDEITNLSLKSSIDILKESIVTLKRIKNPAPWQKQDLADAVIDLHGLEIAYNYYGGNQK